MRFDPIFLMTMMRLDRMDDKMEIAETYCDHCGEALLRPPWIYDSRDERGTRLLVRCRACGGQSVRYAADGGSND